MTSAALEQFDLSGRRAIVTGASRGIGAAISVGLAEAGADVALVARSSSRLERVAGAVRAAGRQALPIECDVCDVESVAGCVERAWDGLGGIDVLVNGAGGPVFQAPILEIQPDGWQRVIDLNLTSVLQVSQSVGRRMVECRSGSIVNIASLVPARAWPAVAGYSAAKAGVISLTQAMAVEWGPVGVRVNAICPGWIQTSLNEPYLAEPKRARTAIEGVPLARWGDAADITGAVIWLASDASRYVSGAAIPVDGGLSIGLPERWLQQMRLD